MGRPVHLIRRFFTSLSPFGPRPDDETWVAHVLSDEEMRLWYRMSRADRRHAVEVARRVERALGHEATDAVLAAALLHDVGKTAARLGTFGRVGATLVAMGGGRVMAKEWSRAGGVTRRVGLYLRHEEIGADMLALAGSHPLTVTWARQHHQPAEEWLVPRHLGEALKAADDD
jgi:putative nucleotidyltransferase with HDIG domain